MINLILQYFEEIIILAMHAWFDQSIGQKSIMQLPELRFSHTTNDSQ